MPVQPEEINYTIDIIDVIHTLSLFGSIWGIISLYNVLTASTDMSRILYDIKNINLPDSMSKGYASQYLKDLSQHSLGLSCLFVKQAGIKDNLSHRKFEKAVSKIPISVIKEFHNNIDINHLIDIGESIVSYKMSATELISIFIVMPVSILVGLTSTIYQMHEIMGSNDH